MGPSVPGDVREEQQGKGELHGGNLSPNGPDAHFPRDDPAAGAIRLEEKRAVRVDAARKSLELLPSMEHAHGTAGERIGGLPFVRKGSHSPRAELGERLAELGDEDRRERVALRDGAERGKVHGFDTLGGERRGRGARQAHVDADADDDAGRSRRLGAKVNEDPAELRIARARCRSAT